MTALAVRRSVASADPLRCLWTAHEALLDFCRDLEDFCRDPCLWSDRRTAARFCDTLTIDLSLHAGDEDEDLMPALRRAGLLARDDALMAVAESEHVRDRHLAARLLPELQQLARGGVCDAIRLVVGGIAFAQGHRRHIAFETRHLLPLAHDLDGAAQVRILAGMAARRGA